MSESISREAVLEALKAEESRAWTILDPDSLRMMGALDWLPRARQIIAELPAEPDDDGGCPDFSIGDKVVTTMGTHLTITGWHYCYSTSPDLTDYGQCGMHEYELSPAAEAPGKES